MALRAEVAVIGLGAAGSAATLALARRGVSVVGLDRLVPPHPFGSTHGRSRVIREAYYESPVYVPLVQRAYELWEAQARDGGRPLFWKTGGLMLGRPDGELVTGARRSAEQHGLPFEVLSASEIRRRFPVFQAADDDVGILEPRAGFLDPEACVETALTLAARAGAELLTGAMVTGWRRRGEGLVLATSRGAIECGTAIVAVGPWAGDLLEDAGLPLTVERQVMYWFRPTGDASRFSPARLPVFIWEWTNGHLFYGIPDHGAGFKVARHHEGQAVTPDTVDRLVQPAEVADMRNILGRTIPDAAGALVEAVTCLYTNTPDHHFVLGPHPAEPRVIIASACSGHGFKFASAIGEVLADLATTGESNFDLRPFRADRFGA
jgi:sarcosine oxidase